LIFKKVKKFLLQQIIQYYGKLFDMSTTTDAVWIVKELMDEILGMVHFRKVQEVMDERMTDDKSEVKEEHDWVSLIDAEMKEVIDGDARPVDCDFCIDTCICEEIDADMKEVIDEEEGGNPVNIVIEKKKEVKFPKYTTMGFNWKEVEPIFKGRYEVMDDSIDVFFRYDLL